MRTRKSDAALLVVKEVKEKVSVGNSTTWVDGVALPVDELDDVNIFAVLKLHARVSGLVGLVRRLLHKRPEILQTEKVILGVVLLIGEALSVLDDQNLAVFDGLCELIEADGVQNPAPSFPCYSGSVCIGREVLL